MSSIFDTASAAKIKKLNLQEFWKRLDSAERESPREQLLRHAEQVWHYTAMRPFACAFTIVTAALALLVFASILSLTFSSQSLLSEQGSSVRATVFIADSASSDVVQQLKNKIAAYPGVQEVTLLSKQDALAKFKTSAIGGLDASMSDITPENNPLPRSLEISLETEGAARLLTTMKSDIQGNPAVELMQFSAAAVGIAATVAQTLRNAVIIVVPLGIVLVGFLIATTIRLSVAASIDEIHTMWILGARRRFVYTPFLIHALLQGFLAGILALFLTFTVQSRVGTLWNESFVPLGLNLTFDAKTGAVSALVLLSSLAASFFAALLALRSSTKEHS